LTEAAGATLAAPFARRHQAHQEDLMIVSKTISRIALVMLVTAMTLVPSVVSADHDNT
jgi:hypothetical protein